MRRQSRTAYWKSCVGIVGLMEEEVEELALRLALSFVVENKSWYCRRVGAAGGFRGSATTDGD
jgi:hypothetical protein